MRLDLSQIRTALARYEKVYRPEAFSSVFRDDRDTFQVVSPVSLAFDIHRNQQQFRLAGGVTTTLELPCSRCLEPFTLPVDALFVSSRRRHTMSTRDWSSDVCSSD